MKAALPFQKKLAGIFLSASMLLAPAFARAEEMAVPPPVKNLLSSIFNSGAVATGITELSSGFMNAGSTHPEADMAIWAAARRSPLPQPFINRIVQAESNYVADADPGTSSACGLTQMIDSVLFEKLYEHGDKYGFNGSAYIEKYMERNEDGAGFTAKYRLRDPAKYNAVRKLCTDPYFAVALGMEHMRDTIYNLQTNTGRTVKYHEAYMGYVFGSNGGTRLMNAHDGRRHNRPAAGFVSSGAVRANHNLFYSYKPGYTTGHGKHRRRHKGHWAARSVDALFAIFLRKLGPGDVPRMETRPLPAPLDTPPMPEGGAASQPAPVIAPEDAPVLEDVIPPGDDQTSIPALKYKFGPGMPETIPVPAQIPELPRIPIPTPKPVP